MVHVTCMRLLVPTDGEDDADVANQLLQQACPLVGAAGLAEDADRALHHGVLAHENDGLGAQTLIWGKGPGISRAAWGALLSRNSAAHLADVLELHRADVVGMADESLVILLKVCADLGVVLRAARAR